MSPWIFSLVAIAGNAAPPGAIDAYRANLASIRVHVEFEVDYYYNKHDDLIGKLARFDPVNTPPGQPDHSVEGAWDFDGLVEHYVMRLTGGIGLDQGRRGGPITSEEVMCNDQIFVNHNIEKPGSNLMVRPRDGKAPVLLLGPLAWSMFQRFDQELGSDAYFSSHPPKRSKSKRGEFSVDVDVYEKTIPNGFMRREISYDPEISFLPRFVRRIASSLNPATAKSGASVVEFYLIDAKPCPAGGFVPTEWYQVHRTVTDFRADYPDYDEETLINKSTKTSKILHYKTRKFGPLEGDPKLDQMEGVNQILAPGGVISQERDFGPMTIGELKTRIGNKIVSLNAPILPNIDVAERNQFRDKPTKSPWVAYCVAASLVVVGALIFRAWRKRMFHLLLLLSPSTLMGCGDRPVTHLSANFANTVVVYEPSEVQLKLPLDVTNDGNRRLTILKVDAGCSCRQADASALPAKLSPGEVRRFTVAMNGTRDFIPQNLTFTFITNDGTFVAPASVLTLPRHHISPASITVGKLPEDGRESEGAFEIVHRELYSSGTPEKSTLIVPGELLIDQLDSRTGQVGNAPGWQYRDASYRLIIKDRTLGLHRTDIGLKDHEGRSILSVPMVWERLPFLACTPERIILSPRTSRVFLRCPDESVEIVRVASAPPGVRALLDSPRSISVSLTKDTPDVLDGFVEIETTAKGRAPLRVPVIRYAPDNQGPRADSQPSS